MKYQILVLIIGIFIFENPAFSQNIKIYYPHGEIAPEKIDISGCTYSKEPVKIIGIVSMESQGGHSGSKDYTSHFIKLKAWRGLEDKELNRNELLVFRTVHKNWDFFNQVPKLSVVEFDIYLNDKRDRSVLINGKFVEEVPADIIDEQLRMIEPVFFETEKYGTFKLDKEIEVFEKTFNWNGAEIIIYLQAADKEQITDHINTLDHLMSNQKEWKTKIDEFAVKHLLPLKNKSWLGEKESKVDRNKFINTYKLESIYIHENGLFEFWHDDGYLFGGHYIYIYGNIKDGPNYWDLPG